MWPKRGRVSGQMGVTAQGACLPGGGECLFRGCLSEGRLVGGSIVCQTTPCEQNHRCL